MDYALNNTGFRRLELGHIFIQKVRVGFVIEVNAMKYRKLTDLAQC
jgi:hypothetical protein